MKKISDLILIIFLIVFYFLFILSQLQFKIFWFDLLNQLVFQLYLGGIFLLLLIIIFKKYKSLMIIIPICIILGYQSLLPCEKCLNYIDEEIDYSSKISLLTYNASYNFNKFDFEKLEDFIVSNDIDILVFQEVSPEFKSNLKRLQNYNFSHNLNENLNFWDTLIMSKFPIHTSKKVNIFTEIQINKENTKIHIIGTHIYPPINQSLYLASTKQLEELENMITIDKSNLIVAGDLNNSYTETDYCEDNDITDAIWSSGSSTIATSDITWYNHPSIPEFQNTLLMTVLKDKMLVRFEFSEDGTEVVNYTEFFNNEWGRLRDICVSPDCKIYLATNGYSWPSQGPNEIIELYNPDFYTNISEVEENQTIDYSIDILGRPVNSSKKGIVIDVYQDGSVTKQHFINTK